MYCQCTADVLQVWALLGAITLLLCIVLINVFAILASPMNDLLNLAPQVRTCVRLAPVRTCILPACVIFACTCVHLHASEQPALGCSCVLPQRDVCLLPVPACMRTPCVWVH